MNPQLSYIFVTKNKLPYLKNRLGVLLTKRQNNEEILIADGGSTDGTIEYLQKLKNSGQIDYFITEPDYGESHALNKLLFECRGVLITAITDDDVYDFDAICACKTFMLEYPEIDFLGTEGGSFNRSFEQLEGNDPLQLVRALNYVKYYQKWQNDHTPFSFCGLGMMWRRSALPILGLFNLSFYSADTEFTFRASAGKANLAWYTGYSFINIKNVQSVTWVHRKKVWGEINRLNKFYLDKNPDLLIIRALKVLSSRVRQIFSPKKTQSAEIFTEQWPKIAQIGEKWLEIKNKEKRPEFIWKR
ncbi:MAG: hypothetical protein A3C79_02010 [Candidatus Taylorbacteria bacterium RIFCSPHIGHO2_02_FULL_45_28]|uniref:Glycosyltransferase 2-like domain-containing protein n=1 Tax=Candidatus Taylorbacteria bacterium RIFCSPHIGHO2_12_FULL_45_16 TaxID=1802315 RepID=A0A1G2N058_9BACT|nr:MAG: hypothetical protein A2830_02815 [Candidatus Taylorbacteria bacterium RIFCSPHIGHO2_01_FULL_44_110]OHA25225.1 MAG: hypothetical protein A3C79_02010 [Candidatus Taylorbacteria bacterium RIFCSPHIGHO2_02_FULL_45_28]OHA29468.1 MAG: hypothetical protein A3F51_00320 [Candidatus Taylorbacteria bacterium RIFCSPHIGHO2_12_FULL_45_16]OHA33230.1 MAG: hypothetical protein A3A23_02850 [Candidatus Taylorbacteria bacterium RIFCSPLOWO2_01_FULL_45_59]OHA38279.1 MAG: hypothetical protein A3I98_03115 [Candi